MYSQKTEQGSVDEKLLIENRTDKKLYWLLSKIFRLIQAGFFLKLDNVEMNLEPQKSGPIGKSSEKPNQSLVKENALLTQQSIIIELIFICQKCAMGVVRMTEKKKKVVLLGTHVKKLHDLLLWRKNKNCAGHLISCEYYKLNSAFSGQFLYFSIKNDTDNFRRQIKILCYIAYYLVHASSHARNFERH